MAKIAIIDLVFHWPPKGGSMVDICEVSRQLQSSGHDVRMFIPDFQAFFPRGRIDQDPGIPITTIPFNRFTFNPKKVPSLFRDKVDDFKPDMVFLADGYFLKPYISEALSHYPQVWREYAYEIFCPKNNLIDSRISSNCSNTILKDQSHCEKCFRHHFLFRKTWIKFFFPILLNPGAIFLFQEYWLSGAYKSKFLDIFRKSLDRQKMIVVYNRLQASFFKPFNPNIVLAPTGVSERFNPPKISPRNKKVKILVSGRLNDPVKGFKTLLYACRKLWEIRKNFELIITNPPELRVPDFPFVKTAGWLTQEQLAKLTQTVDIVCVPSYWEEAFGIVAIEGMACEKPVIAARVGGLQESVVNGQTGLLFKPKNDFDLFEKLMFLIDHPEIRRQYGRNGLQRVDQYYRWPGIMDRIYQPIFS